MASNRERVRRTREAIVGSALELLDDRPAGKVALVDVAERAGLSRSCVYRHFAGVDEILLACAARFSFGLGEGFGERLAAGGPEGVGRAVFSEYLEKARLIQGHPRRYEALEAYCASLWARERRDGFFDRAAQAHAAVARAVCPDLSGWRVGQRAVGSCLAGAWADVARRWVGEGLRESAEEVARAAAGTELAVIEGLCRARPGGRETGVGF